MRSYYNKLPSFFLYGGRDCKILIENKIKHLSINGQMTFMSKIKICGILLESQLPNYLVIGVGINVNQKVSYGLKKTRHLNGVRKKEIF